MLIVNNRLNKSSKTHRPGFERAISTPFRGMRVIPWHNSCQMCFHLQKPVAYSNRTSSNEKPVVVGFIYNLNQRLCQQRYYQRMEQALNKTLYWNGHNLFGHQLWELICDSLCPRHVERNYVPLFGVQTAWHNRTSTYVIT